MKKLIKKSKVVKRIVKPIVKPVKAKVKTKIKSKTKAKLVRKKIKVEEPIEPVKSHIAVLTNVEVKVPKTAEQTANSSTTTFEKVVRISSMPFEQQMSVVFNPLQTMTKTESPPNISEATKIIEHQNENETTSPDNNTP
jgi:hypothetical protein